MSVIELRDVSRVYESSGGVETVALAGVDLRIDAGEMVAVMGASGSGKSTLINVLGLLDRGFTGEYLLNGTNVRDLSGNDAAELRNDQIGFVFQQFNLLPRTSVLDNVLLPAQYHKGGKPRARALEVIEQVGLVSELHKKSNQLSGGQMQRVAIARALLYAPALVLADEPTGNLDSHTAAEIMSILAAANAAGATIVLITHEDDIAAYASRRVRMRDGQLVADSAEVPA
ncbi:MAG: ABC transporter ATP-binding protein [Actinobacteria bacterium]|nr:MAG: ABC transporter ATP-binding protein [Actinomycetota bacterium]